MRELPGLFDVNSDLQIASPTVKVDIDRDHASTMGVTADKIENALYDAFGQRQVSDIYTPTNDYQVLLELLPRFQLDPAALHLLYLRSDAGKLVPLDAVTKPRNTVGPLSVTHLGQLPSVTLSFNLAPGVSLGDAVGRIETAARETLPADIQTSFQGVAAAFQSSLQGMGMLLVMAILVIYMVLGILYESFIHPLTILSGLPSAGLGALATLLIFHDELNIYSFVGIIMLIGIVKKNAIMMIDFALNAAHAGFAGAGGDLGSVPGAISADHDDHDGGTGRVAADRFGVRCGFRVAASIGTGDGRRLGGFAGADALHNAHRVPAGLSSAESGCEPLALRSRQSRPVVEFGLLSPRTRRDPV